MVHFSQLISAAALVSVSSAVPMARRYAPSATMSTYSSYQTGSYQGSSSNMDSSYGSSYDSSYGAADSSYGSMDSSYGGMDSSYGGMDSSYGSADSSYGSADSSYQNSWNSTSTEAVIQAMTSSSSSSYATQTSSALYTQATYGSGSASWSGSSGYDSCVQQCSAQFGAPPSATTPPSDEVSGTSTSSSAGATHTIIVSPSAGSLQYVPFATNASIGDTITFEWKAGTHTVTQSSALEVCNKTANGFASGMRSEGALFNQVINDTQPIWFYCGVPGHCKAGMFGGINIGNPQQTSDSSSNSSYMPMSSVLSDMAQDSDISSAWNYTVSVVGSNSSLSNWGMDINCAGMSDDNKKLALLNVMFSQATMAMNPAAFQNGRVVNASVPLKLPQQLAAASNATQNGSSTTPPPTANGVGSLLAPRYAVALMAVFASFVLL